MKKTLFLLPFCFITLMQAQVSKTINSISPGKLSTLITSVELQSVSNLTLSGSIDARDFLVIRDSMPSLEKIDLSGVTIIAYIGYDGTSDNRLDSTYNAKEIPPRAFYNKTKLVSITMPDNILTISNYAFYGCENLTNLIIPPNVTTIGYGVFLKCNGLAKIIIPSVVSEIGTQSFSSDIVVDSNNPYFSAIDGVLTNKTITKLISCPISKHGDYIVPTGITCIGDDAFRDCDKISSITLPSTVNDFGWGAFQECDNLITISATTPIIHLGLFCFNDCIKLTNFNVSLNVNSIPVYCFKNCKKLSNIIIPSTVETIWDGAFEGCESIKSFTIPSSVDSIVGNSFDKCNGLQTITVDPSNKKYSSVDGVLYNRDKTQLIWYPALKEGTYTLPSTVSIMYSFGFSTCTQLSGFLQGKNQNFTVLDSVLYNKDKTVLIRYPSLKTGDFTVPNILTKFSIHAFNYCAALESIHIYSNTPPELPWNFRDTIPGLALNLEVYVPNGTYWDYMFKYMESPNFKNIIEMPYLNTSLKNNKNMKVYGLYPNPTSGLFCVNTEGVSNISIYDINGKLLLQKDIYEEENISLGDISKGLYIVKIKNENSVFTDELIIY